MVTVRLVSPYFTRDTHELYVDEETGEAYYGNIRTGKPKTYRNVALIGTPLSSTVPSTTPQEFPSLLQDFQNTHPPRKPYFSESILQRIEHFSEDQPRRSYHKKRIARNRKKIWKKHSRWKEELLSADEEYCPKCGWCIRDHYTIYGDCLCKDEDDENYRKRYCVW